MFHGHHCGEENNEERINVSGQAQIHSFADSMDLSSDSTAAVISLCVVVCQTLTC